RRLGVRAEDIQTGHAARIGFIGNAAYTVEGGPLGDGPGAEAPMAGAARAGDARMISIRLGAPERFAELDAALAREGATAVTAPDFQVADPDGQARAAKLDALRRARADAEAYAAALDMRVARIVRVADAERSADDAIEMIRLMSRDSAPDARVETRAAVTVEFALAPK
ncbi:DUF541 domain-containing protein, partial [Sphingomonas parva]